LISRAKYRTGLDGKEGLEWLHEHHKGDHNAEDLDAVSRHPHHESVHWDLFCGAPCDFPRFLDTDKKNRE
jgi:hypothetical protein